MKTNSTTEKLPFVVVDTTELTEGERLFADKFGREVIGQPEVARVAQMAYNAYHNPLRDRERPIGVYFLVGKSRTGKSKTARALAKIFHGREDALTRISASGYMDDHEMSDLKGAPPSYVGYRDPKDPKNKLEAHDVDPYSLISPHNMKRVRLESGEVIDIVVIEEFEKGCPEFFKLWMDIFDRGQLKLRNGEVADFRNAVIIMTSNLATRAIEKAEKGSIGFISRERRLTFAETKDEVTKALTAAYPKEFRNRLDAVVVFRDLDENDIKAIIGAEIGLVEERIAEQMPRGSEFGLKVEESARAFLLAEAGGEVAELKRVIERHVMQPLGRILMGGKVKGGDLVKIAHDGNSKSLTFSVSVNGAGQSDADRLSRPYGGDTAESMKGLSFQRRVHRAKANVVDGSAPVEEWSVILRAEDQSELAEEGKSLMHDITEVIGAEVAFVGFSRKAPWVCTLTVEASMEQIELVREKYPTVHCNVVKSSKAAR